MQDMIKRIIEADNEAKALEKATEVSVEKEKVKIEEDAEAIYQKYMDDAQEEIKRDSEYLEKRTERSIAEANSKQESTLIKLRADFEHNRDRWADEIFNRVIS